MSRTISEIAVSLLARREHSELELRRKLQQRHFQEEEITVLIDQLKAKKLLSDERFTESYINMRKHRGYGPLRIAQELRERGVDADLIDAFLDKSDPEWQSLMQQQYAKKYGNQLAEEYNEKVRRAKYLQNRGFPLDWVFKLNPLDDY